MGSLAAALLNCASLLALLAMKCATDRTLRVLRLRRDRQLSAIAVSATTTANVRRPIFLSRGVLL
jgi:hypothetical protein